MVSRELGWLGNQYNLCVIGYIIKEIEVFGSGCKKCIKTAELIQAIADDCGVTVRVVKESSAEIMLKYGVMSTPAVVVDKQLVHSGFIPDSDTIAEWLK